MASQWQVDSAKGVWKDLLVEMRDCVDPTDDEQNEDFTLAASKVNDALTDFFRGIKIEAE